MTRYKLQIDPGIFARFPSYSTAILYAVGIENKPATAPTVEALRAAEAKARAAYDGKTTADSPHINSWRDAYSAFGAKPSKYPCSVDSLLKRVLKGQNLPEINEATAIYNRVSIEYELPVGGEDWDKITSDLVLTFATGTEPFDFRENGEVKTELVAPGEVVWRDSTGVTCRRWSWRQCLRTALGLETKAAYFVFDRLDPYPPARLMEAVRDLARCIHQGFPGASLTGELWTARGTETFQS